MATKRRKTNKTKDKKTGAKTPALPSERIKGSKVNKRLSATKERAKSIKLNDTIIKGLKNKQKEHNEAIKKPSQKANLGALKAVYRRGAGAFSVSHRPGKTRNQWAYARVNAFLKLLKAGKPANKSYVTDNDLLPKGHPKKSK